MAVFVTVARLIATPTPTAVDEEPEFFAVPSALAFASEFAELRSVSRPPPVTESPSAM